MSVGPGGEPGVSAHDPDALAAADGMAELERIAVAAAARAATPPLEPPPLPEPPPAREPPVDLRYQQAVPIAPPRAYARPEPQVSVGGGYETYGADLTPLPVVPPLPPAYPTGGMGGFGGQGLAHLAGGLGGAYGPPGTQPAGLPVLGQPVGPVPTARQATGGIQGIQTLADLYAAVPDFGNGSYRVRVERSEPKVTNVNGQNVRCGGYLGDFVDRLGDGDFAMLFGGGRYELLVVGPSRTDPTIEKTLAKLEMYVSGPPVKIYYDAFAEHSMNRHPYQGQNAGNAFGGYPAPYPQFVVPQGPPQQHPQVAIKQLDLEHEEKRLIAAASQHSGAEALRAVEKLGELRAEGLRQAFIDNQAALRERDAQVQALTAEKFGLVKDLAEARQRTETEAIRDLKDNYEREDRRMRDAHGAEVSRLREDFAREKAQIVDMHKMAFEGESRRHDDERKKLYDDLRDERDKARADLDRRIADIERSHAATVTGMKESYEGRLRDKDEAHKETVSKMSESHKEAVARMAESHDREMRMYQKSEEVQRTVIAGSHDTKVTLYEREVQRLREDLDHAERDLSEARDKLHEDPASYIDRTAHFATNVLGMKKADEGDKPFDWKEVAGKAFEKLPELMKSVMDARGQAVARAQSAQGVSVRELPPGPDAQAQAQHAAARAQQERFAMEQHRQRVFAQQQQQAGLGGPPPGAPPAQRRPMMAPAPAWLGGVPAQGQDRREQTRPPVTGIPNLRQAAARPPVSDIPLTGDMASPLSPSKDGAGSVRATDPTPVRSEQVDPGIRPAAASPPQAPLAPAFAPQALASVNGSNGASNGVAGHAVPAAEAQLAPAPPPAVPANIGVKDIEAFFASLEEGIKNSQLVPAESFAERFVEQIGIDQARATMAQLDGAKILALLEDLSEKHEPLRKSIVLTREGREYTLAVFAATRRLVGM